MSSGFSWSELIGRYRVPRRMLACWLLLLALTALGGRLMNGQYFAISFGWHRWYTESMIASFMCSLFALATIVGGLMGRSWVASWLGSVLLACIHTAVFISVSDQNFQTPELWITCSLWPALLLSTCAPLVLMRAIFGWTLVRTDRPGITRWPYGLEDLMILGVVIACSMTTTQVTFYFQGYGNSLQLMLLMLAFAGVSVVCIPVTVYVSFRLETWRPRLAGWLILSGVAFVVIFCSDAILEYSWSSAFRNLKYMCVGVPTGCLTVAVGIIAMRSSGYRLTYFKSPARQITHARHEAALSIDAPEVLHNPTDIRDTWLDDGIEESSRAGFSLNAKWQARIATAIIVLVATASGIGIQLDKQRNINFYRQFKDEKLQAARIRANVLDALAFVPGFSDSDLQRYTKHAGTVRELSLAGTNVTDAVFPTLDEFSFLDKLDLSRTSITSEGLLRWGPFANPSEFNRMVRRLSLADTKVDWLSVSRSKSLHFFDHLDLSGLKITDQHLAEPIPVKGLTLARNPITDGGIESLLKNQGIYHLDLTDTQIVGTTLATPLCPQDLVLDGTNITDATLTDILKTGRVTKLSIARTQITPALLPLLVKVPCLRLGKGLITEADLGALTTVTFDHLWLNDQQFTGLCFQTGLWAHSINFSGSNINDDILIAICGTRQLQDLGLASTRVTGRAVQFLPASEINLCHTRVTASDLENRTFYGPVTVSLNQFTPEEMSRLRRSSVQIGDQSFFNSDDLW